MVNIVEKHQCTDFSASTNDELMKIFSSLVDTYNKSFKEVTKLTLEQNKVRGPTPKVGHQYAITKRIKSSHEKMTSTKTGTKSNRSVAYNLGGKMKNDNFTCIKNVTAKESCSFCSGNHQVPTLELKKSLGEPLDSIKVI